MPDLIASQCDVVEELLRGMVGRLPTIKQHYGSVKRFVQGAYDKHKAQIETWDDWSFEYTNPEGVIPSLHPNTVRAVWINTAGYKLGRLPHPSMFSHQEWVKPTGVVEVLEGLNVKFRTGQAVTRAVMRVVGGTEQEYYWQRFFTRLGEQWMVLKNPKIVITCAPEHFIRLGHYGENSCYTLDGYHERSKFNLTQVVGSYVGLVYKRQEDQAPMGRWWGMFATGGAIVTNRYNFPWAGYRSVIRRALSSSVGREVMETPILKQIDNPLQPLHFLWAYVNSDTRAFVVEKSKDALLQHVKKTCETARDHGKPLISCRYY